MLKQSLIHPPLLAALASAGHGSRVLVADANFPVSTVRSPRAETVFLNLSPGLIGMGTLLPVLLSAVSVEAATLMRHPEGQRVPAHEDHVELLRPDTRVDYLERYDFYAAVRSEDVGLIIATGDLRACSNVLLHIGMP